MVGSSFGSLSGGTGSCRTISSGMSSLGSGGPRIGLSLPPCAGVDGGAAAADREPPGGPGVAYPGSPFIPWTLHVGKGAVAVV
jgi:hypothetical protein